MKIESKVGLVTVIMFFIGFIAYFFGDFSYLALSMLIYKYGVPLLVIASLVTNFNVDKYWVSILLLLPASFQSVLYQIPYLYYFMFIGPAFFLLLNPLNYKRLVWVFLSIIMLGGILFWDKPTFWLLIPVFFLMFTDGNQVESKNELKFIWLYSFLLFMPVILNIPSIINYYE